MIGHSLAARYANVFFKLDYAEGVLDRRLGDFDAFQSLLRGNPKLLKLLRSPDIELIEKQKILEETLGTHAEKRFVQFLLYLIEKKRLKALDMIATEYRQRVDEQMGIWEAEITTAVPMDLEMEQKLQAKLEDHFDRKVTIKKEVDPRMVGGAVLIVDNSLIDWSVKARLRQMKEYLQATKV